MSNVARRSVYQESESTVSSRRRTRGFRCGSSGMATERQARWTLDRDAAGARACALHGQVGAAHAVAGREDARHRGGEGLVDWQRVARPELQAELAVEPVVALDA